MYKSISLKVEGFLQAIWFQFLFKPKILNYFASTGFVVFMPVYSYRKTKPLNEELTDLIVTEQLLNEKRKLVNFVVLQLYEKNGKIYEIKKHDFSEGVYNVHEFYSSLSHRQEFPEEQLTSELYWKCKKDIKENWLEYRERYRKKHLKSFI